MVNNTLNNIIELINLSKNTISYNNIKAFIDYNFNGNKLYLDQDDKLYFDIVCQDVDCPDNKLLTPAELGNSYYMLLDTNKINSDIGALSFKTSTLPDDFEIESFLFNYASSDMCVYLYYIKFLEFIYENIYKNNSDELENITNDSLYDKIFEFNLTIKDINNYKFNVVHIPGEENTILKFKLNKVNIEKKNKNNLLKFINSDNSVYDSIMDSDEYSNSSNFEYYSAFDKLIFLISNDDLFEQLDILNSSDKWRSNINVRINTLYTKLKYILILTLQCYLKERHSTNFLSLNTSFNLLQFSQNLINNKVTSYENMITELSTQQSEQLSDIKEKEHITNLLNKTHELKKINENIESKKLKISQMNKVVSDQQSKLNKINVVLVITIIMFIYLVVCLILYEYINRNVYISFGFLLLVSLIIYFYIYRLKKTAYIIAENFTDDNTNGPYVEILTQDSSQDSSPSPSPAPPTGYPANGKKQKVIDIYQLLQNLDNKTENIEDLSKTYGLNSNDILTPLLNKEYKKYTEKNKNMNLHDKITKFNVNISKRDIKFTLETINYIINLSILFIVILFTISYNKYATLSIGLVIFIILTMIYFVKIVRVIRTKSYNYYWDKPKNTVEKL